MDDAEARAQVALAIRACRLSRGLQQADVAVRLGVDASYLSLIETGRWLPSCANILRLADALEVTTDELLGVKPIRGDMTPEDVRLLSELRRRLSRAPKEETESDDHRA